MYYVIKLKKNSSYGVEPLPHLLIYTASNVYIVIGKSCPINMVKMAL